MKKEKRNPPEPSTEYIGLAVYPETKAKLEEMAKREQRSLAAEVRVAIQKHIAAEVLQ